MIARALIFVLMLVGMLGIHNAANANDQPFSAMIYCTTEADAMTLVGLLMNGHAREAGTRMRHDATFQCYNAPGNGAGPMTNPSIAWEFETDFSGPSCVLKATYIGGGRYSGGPVWALAVMQACNIVMHASEV